MKSRSKTRVSRRSRTAPPVSPALPSGWRASRRTSTHLRKARLAARLSGMRERAIAAVSRFRGELRGAGYIFGLFMGGFFVIVVALLVLALGINSIARWNAIRVASANGAAQVQNDAARDNLLIVSVAENNDAKGFMAVRFDPKTDSIFGIAIPETTFLEIPGRGFEQASASWDVGPSVSLDMISNFIGVPFLSYLTIPPETYTRILTEQSFALVPEATVNTSLDQDSIVRFTNLFDTTLSEDIAVVPLPVKPISLGEQTFFEPRRDEIADLLKTWWGVEIDAEQAPTRVIVYNGAGTPGIAGIAAQQLIRGGLRVIDTKNADRFDYAATSIIVQNGPVANGHQIAEVLGVGNVVEQPADQRVADVVVIIGKDYRPPNRPNE